MKFILRKLIERLKKLLILIMMFEKRHIQSESYLITTTYELKSIYKLENKFNSNYVYFSCLPYFDLSL